MIAYQTDLSIVNMLIEFTEKLSFQQIQINGFSIQKFIECNSTARNVTMFQMLVQNTQNTNTKFKLKFYDRIFVNKNSVSLQEKKSFLQSE